MVLQQDKAMSNIEYVTYQAMRLSVLQDELPGIMEKVKQDGKEYMYHEFNFVPEELKWECLVYVRNNKKEITDGEDLNH